MREGAWIRLFDAPAVALTAAAPVPQASAQGAGKSSQGPVGAREGAWPHGLVVALTGTDAARLRRVPVSRLMAVSAGVPIVDPGWVRRGCSGRAPPRRDIGPHPGRAPEPRSDSGAGSLRCEGLRRRAPRPFRTARSTDRFGERWPPPSGPGARPGLSHSLPPAPRGRPRSLR